MGQRQWNLVCKLRSVGLRPCLGPKVVKLRPEAWNTFPGTVKDGLREAVRANHIKDGQRQDFTCAVAQGAAPRWIGLDEVIRVFGQLVKPPFTESKFIFGLSSLGDIHHARQDKRLTAVSQRNESDFDWNFASILALCGEVTPHTHRTGIRFGDVVQPVGRMLPVSILGHQHPHGVPN